MRLSMTGCVAGTWHELQMLGLCLVHLLADWLLTVGGLAVLRHSGSEIPE